MELCTDRRHSDVVFACLDCPVCELIEALDEVQNDLKKAKRDIEDLHLELEEANSRLL